LKAIIFLSLIIIAGLLNSCRSSDAVQQSSQKFKPVIDAYVYAWNTGIVDTLNAICDSTVTRYDGIAPGYEYRGLSALKKFISGYRTMFPDFKLVPEEEFYVGDRAILRWIVSGTHTGPGFLAPTGKSFKLSGMSLCRFKDGRLIEDKAESDGLYFMEQLGYNIVPSKNK
jgi:predicted ester cyclase